MTFEIKQRDAAGRIGLFTVKHKTVDTPALLPVINPNKLLIPPSKMKELFGVEILITNSYIIYKDQELRKNALRDGVHELLNFDGAIMTDSGAFQSYVYDDIDVNNREMVEFQQSIQSDIGTILDVFGVPDESQSEAEKGIEETVKRAHEGIEAKKDMLLACTVQGSTYNDLRTKCAEEISETNADVYPIGGVVPLMEEQRYRELTKCILACKKGLDVSKPVHLFGAGHPLVFSLAVALGCDLFDSSAYAKYAADDRMMFTWGTAHLDSLEELPCCCPVCSKYKIDEIKKMKKDERTRVLAEHNLFVSFAEIKRIKQAIKEGSLWELVERRATGNPYLLEALKVLEQKDNKQWLEQYEPISKKSALFYTGSHTVHRPLIYRHHKRILERYEPSSTHAVVFPERGKPYARFYQNEITRILQKKKTDFLVNTIFGPIPILLDEMYPFAQSVTPDDKDFEKDRIIEEFREKLLKKYAAVNRHTAETTKQNAKKQSVLDESRVKAVVNMQFDQNAANALFQNAEMELKKSRKTGKIRNVFVNGKHVLSMRAHDGFFTLKIAGGKLLHEYFDYPRLRVVVDDEAKPFVKDGKSVFAKFVKDCDPELRPLDECLVVDTDDTLLAVGRAMLNKKEMLAFDQGMAAKTREGISQ